MVCDHCGYQGRCIRYSYYDLCLCDSCNDKFQRKEWQNKRDIDFLDDENAFWDFSVVPYSYSKYPKIGTPVPRPKKKSKRL